MSETALPGTPVCEDFSFIARELKKIEEEKAAQREKAAEREPDPA